MAKQNNIKISEDEFDYSEPKKAITENGDIYEIGRHRLMCGDSTNYDDVAKLMENNKADLIVTDPPYYEKSNLNNILSGAFANYEIFSKQGCPIYISHPAGFNQVIFWDNIMNVGWNIHQQLIWVKDSMVLGHSDYHYMHEPITFCYKKGSGRTGREGNNWYGDNSQKSVLYFDRPKASKNHPTEKPIGLWATMVGNSSKKQDIILDLFMGSGTTMVCCEQMNRLCFGMEIAPNYCDVIVARLINHSPSITIKRNGITLGQNEMQKYLDNIKS